MKKTVIAVACAATLAAVLVGCGNAPTPGGSDDASGAPAPTTSAPVADPGNDTGGPAGSQTPAAGFLAIDMGERSMLDVHATDEGAVADAVVQMTNVGDVPLALGDGNIKIGDANGNVIVDVTDRNIFIAPSYLAEGCSGFIYTGNPLPLPDGYAAEGDYLLKGTATMTPIAGVYELPVSNVALGADDDGVPRLTGTVTNNTDKTFEFAEIAVAYVDNEDNMLGVASCVTAGLAPDESLDFEIDGYTLPAGCTMATISGYDVIANAPQF